MTNKAPFKHKQWRPGGVPSKKPQGRQIDGGGGGGVRAPIFNFALGGPN